MPGHVITLRLTSTPRLAELLHVLDALAWANARWYCEQWDEGKDPPCCSGCAEIRYLADQPHEHVTLRAAAELLRAGVGSCGELVALEVGIRRAKALREGKSHADAARAARVELEPLEPNVWHAVMMTPSGRVDPCAEKIASTQGARERCGCDG